MPQIKKYSSYYPYTLNQYLKIMIMKRIITFLLAFSCLFTASAQAPQAVCYQGVATDQQGRELISQNIRVRLSILKTSTAGAEEWIETHSVTTDGFGLFDLPIGNGTRVGGAQTAFSNIKWGADKYFLKVEMDITGGSSYVLMGVNQLISVPYALYSDKTGVADSAIASSRSLTAITAITANTANYAINSGRALTAGRSDTAQFAWLADSARRAAFALNANYAANAGRALTAARSDTALFAWLADSARRAAFALNANYAANAGRALTAARSDTAQFAWLADSARRAAYAYNANRAASAGRSDTAQFAWLADSSRRAATAVLARRATVADSAILADHSVVSDRSTFASQASFAFLADSSRRAFQAQQALTALDDRDRDPLNEIQTMSFDTTTSTLKLPIGFCQDRKSVV